MKTVYFVRHGQTLRNTQHIHQGPEEPLTELGKKQSHEVALKLKKKNIDTLVSSPFVRAMETAGIISDELDLPINKFDGVKEFKRPDPLYGRSHISLASARYVWSLFQHRNDPNWNNDGAENMFSIRNRIIDTKRFVAGLEGERIVIVSHAIYIDMFAKAVCADRSLKLREFVGALLGAKKLSNTGVVVFQLNENAPPETCNWWLVNEETDQQYLKYR